jgi:hypothetical protein
MHIQKQPYLVLDHSLGLHEKLIPLILKSLQKIKYNENKENKNETSRINTEKSVQK